MTVGIIGIGHLAASMIEGFLRSGMAPDDLLLSPRGRAPAIAVAKDIPLARDNAAVVEGSDIVIVAVRPQAVETAVAGLPWRRGQMLVSACAGVPIERFVSLAPAPEIVRIMPLTAAEFGASPTLVLPASIQLDPILSLLGPVIPIQDEREFEIATVNAAIYGWVQALIRVGAEWSRAQGLDARTARQLAAQTFVAAGRMVNEKNAPMSDLLDQIATPGGITETGLAHLDNAGVPAAWEEACELVLRKLREGS